MKPLVIFHSSCADGFGAAFAAWLKFGDDAEYLPMQYGKDDVFKIPPWTARDVYILDFSLPRDYMDKIFSEAKRVVWLDHHVSSRDVAIAICEYDAEEVKDYPRLDHEELQWKIVHDNNKSGAVLSWEYFHPDKEVPLFIKHIDDYDRWVFALGGTKEFNKALWSHAPWSFEQWAQFLEDTGFSANDGTGIDAWYREGVAILRAHDQNVQSVVKGAARKCWLTKTQSKANGEHWEVDWLINAHGLAANCPPHLASDVGHELANQSGTFGLLWTLSKNNVCKCSLRSNPGYDVSVIAKAFGGGGHATSAGFEVEIQTLLGWLK